MKPQYLLFGGNQEKQLFKCNPMEHHVNVFIIFIKPVLFRAKKESGRSEMEEQFSSLSRVPPFWYETSVGSKPANRALAKYPAILPCEFGYS